MERICSDVDLLPTGKGKMLLMCPLEEHTIPKCSVFLPLIWKELWGIKYDILTGTGGVIKRFV